MNSIKERRLRNTSGGTTTLRWTAPVSRKTSSSFDPSYLGMIVFLLVCGALVFLMVSSMITSAINAQSSVDTIILNSQYDKMTLVLDGQAKLDGNKLYVGNSQDPYVNPTAEFAFKDNGKIIHATLTEGQYYKIYKITDTDYYAESYSPPAQ